MRFLSFLFILLLTACSSHELKYKYSSSRRYLASLTTEEVRVSRVEASLKNEEVFASGLDSTFIIVKLFDSDNNLLLNVDPNDLTLSASADLEAKPFSLKHGVYKSQIQPRVKSQNIRMRIDWQERILSDELVLKATLKPLKDKLVPIYHESIESKSVGEIDVARGSGSPQDSTDGFSIDNLGDNKIVDNKRFQDSQRSFHFSYIEQARQNIAMEVDDIPNNTISHTMHSLFMFFPRKRLPTVEQLSGTLDVTLSNGEKIIFQKDSKEIVDGVFSEGAVDTSSNRHKRHFADLRYRGLGVVLRANARGQSPQLGQFENNKIDMEYGVHGSVDVLIINGRTGQRCRRPKIDFWDEMDVNPIEFKFPTDEEFNTYLKTHCGFKLPKS